MRMKHSLLAYTLHVYGVAPLDSCTYMFKNEYEYVIPILVSCTEAYEKFGEFFRFIKPLYSDEFPHLYQYNKHGTAYGAL